MINTLPLHHLSRRTIALSVVGVISLAACGSDDDTSDAPAAATTTAATDDADVLSTAPARTDDDDAIAEDEAMADDTAMANDEAVADDEATDDDAMADDDEATDDDGDGVPLVQLQFAGLPVLGDASVYEGWAIIDDAPVSTGRFTVDEAGNQLADDGSEIDHFAVDTTAATAFVLTLEPTVDDDPAPSEIHLLGGDVVDGSARLSIDHPTAIDADLTTASGSVEVVVPTAPDASIDTAGIWFFEDGSGSLTIPELPAGWVYEGWAEFDGIPVSTGRFTDPDMADDFNGFSGDDSGPATPGEDFIRNAPDGLEFPRSAAGATVVVSVEPVDDDSPAPFVLKALIGELPAEVERLGQYPLTNTGTDTFPTGVASILPGGSADT